MIKEIQNALAAEINCNDALVQGGCKAVAEVALDVENVIATQTGPLRGVCAVVCVPSLENASNVGSPFASASVEIHFIEIPALRGKRGENALTALEAAGIAATALDGATLQWERIYQYADDKRGALVAVVSFKASFALSKP